MPEPQTATLFPPDASPSAVNSRPAPRDGKLPSYIKICWGSGAIGVPSLISVASTLFMLFLTDYVGLTAVFAGTVLFTAKFYDTFTDFAVGFASDHFNTPWGRRRPWMFAGVMLAAASCPMMFHIDLVPMALRPAFAVISVVVLFTGYSMFYVPYLAMSVEMTRSYAERTSLMAFAYGFGTLSFLSGISLPSAILALSGGGQAGYHRMGWLIALLPLTGLIAVFGTARAPVARREHTPRKSPSVWIGSLLKNRPLLVLTFAKSLHYFATTCLVSALVYFTIQVLRVGPEGMVITGVAMTCGSLSGVYFFVRLSRGLDKHVIYSLGMAGMAASTLLFALLNARTGLPMYGVVCFVFGAAAASLVMAEALLPDVLQWDHHISGLRREGAVSSMMSAIAKTTPAFSSLLVGYLLSHNGYMSGHPGAVQSPGVIRTIYFCVAILPAILLLVAAASLYFGYDLTREKLERDASPP